MAKPVLTKYTILDGNGEFRPENAKMWEDRKGEYLLVSDVKEEMIALGYYINELKNHISSYYSSYADSALFETTSELEKFYIEIRKSL